MKIRITDLPYMSEQLQANPWSRISVKFCQTPSSSLSPWQKKKKSGKETVFKFSIYEFGRVTPKLTIRGPRIFITLKPTPLQEGRMPGLWC